MKTENEDKIGAWIKVVMIQVLLSLPLIWMNAVGVI